jgi:transcription termination factor Rho
MTEVWLLSEDVIAKAPSTRKRTTKATTEQPTVQAAVLADPAPPAAKPKSKGSRAATAPTTVTPSIVEAAPPPAVREAIPTAPAPAKSKPTKSAAAASRPAKPVVTTLEAPAAIDPVETKTAKPKAAPRAEVAVSSALPVSTPAPATTVIAEQASPVTIDRPAPKRSAKSPSRPAATAVVAPAESARVAADQPNQPAATAPIAVAEAQNPPRVAALPESTTTTVEAPIAKPVRRTIRRAVAPAATSETQTDTSEPQPLLPETAPLADPVVASGVNGKSEPRRAPSHRIQPEAPVAGIAPVAEAETSMSAGPEPVRSAEIANLEPSQQAPQSAPRDPAQDTGQEPRNPAPAAPAQFRPQQSNQNRPATFRPAGQQRPPQGPRPQQPFTPRPQAGQQMPIQPNDADSQRGRRRRRRRGRGAPVGPGQINANGSSAGTGIVSAPPAYEERAPIMEFIPQQRMPVFEVHGILDFLPNGEAFLREDDLRHRNDDPLIGVRDIRRFDMRNADTAQLEARPGRGRGPVTVERVICLNDVPYEPGKARTRFEDLTPIYPDRMIKLETGQTPITTRMLDLIAPVGFGQRALIVSPPKAGKTTVLKHIGQGVITNYPDAALILCLVGERPEEVTDLRMSLPKAIMFASSFDEEVERHGHLAEMALERAKRLAEQGRDVVVLLDSITRLARAYNLGPGGGGGRTLSGGMDASALTTARRIFGAARAIEQGGSLTIIATCLVDTGSRLDDVVYEEFKGTGNMELHLDRALAERRIFPAIEINKSSTRKEELLLDPTTLHWVTLLRRRLAGANSIQATEQFIDRLGKTPSNKVFLDLLARTQS